MQIENDVWNGEVSFADPDAANCQADRFDDGSPTPPPMLTILAGLWHAISKGMEPRGKKATTRTSYDPRHGVCAVAYLSAGLFELFYET